MQITLILIFVLITFEKLVRSQKPKPVTEAPTTTIGIAETHAVDLEDDTVGSDLDGMKALFNATLSG